MASEELVREVKNRHSQRLLSQPGVSGVGVEKDAHGEFVLALHVDSEDFPREQVPEEIEGIPVKLIHSGPFRRFS